MSAKVVGLAQKDALGYVLSRMMLAVGNDPRQVSLLRAEAREWMLWQPQEGLCFARFTANILLEALPAQALTIGTVLQVGDVLLEVAQSKHCFEQCALSSRPASCHLKSGSAFARVKVGGQVQVGDAVVVRFT